MLNKSLIIAAIVLVLLITFGLLEVMLIGNCLNDFGDELAALDQVVLDKTVTEEQFDKVWDTWSQKRTSLELFLNHTDIIEMEMRMAECRGYMTNKDYDNLHVQLTVLIELTQHVINKNKPTIEHVL